MARDGGSARRLALPAAVIFDCDGTLVDSEPLADAAWTEVLRHRGHRLTDDDRASIVGRSYGDTYAYLRTVAPLPDAARLWDEFAAELYRRFAAGLRVFPDAAATVRRLAASGVPLAVASSSPRERLGRTLALTGLGHHFAVVVAGDEVANGKPAPDMVVAAARGLGVRPERCVVVEDTPTGVAAGVAAGAAVVAVARDGADPDALLAADVVVGRLDVEAIERAARR